MNKLLIPFIVVSSLLVGALAWSFVNKPTTIIIDKPVQSNPVAEQTKIIPSPYAVATLSTTQDTEGEIEYANPSVVIDAIETAIPEKNYGDLFPLMTDKVSLIKYATSCCGLITNSQAVSELTYLNNATGPWDFSETNPIAKKLETDDPEHFKDMWIGTSADFYAVGFKWNDEFLIEKISIVNNYHLITGD